MAASGRKLHFQSILKFALHAKDIRQELTPAKLLPFFSAH
jgi:hypothetical protein